MKKYELTQETIIVGNRTLYRIQAVKFFKGVRPGDLGGYVESENNLSYEGNCWISDNARVMDNGWVSDNARVSENACVFGNAQIYDRARISGDARIYGGAYICGKAQISGCAWIAGYVSVYKGAKLYSGIWNRLININHRYYLVSTTLKKLYVGV